MTAKKNLAEMRNRQLSAAKKEEPLCEENIFSLQPFCSLLQSPAAKKKETIDLSSLHTTEAAEIQENETDTPTEGGTLDLTTDKDTKKSESSGSKYSVTTSMETYSEGGVSIQYPALSNLSDSELEKKINEMLRTNAIAVAKAKGLPKEGSTLDVKATVESSNLKRFVVSYKGKS